MSEPNDRQPPVSPETPREEVEQAARNEEPVATDVPAAPASPVEEPALELPRWVAPAIGITLVVVAGMAVWTGFRPSARTTDMKYVLTEPREPISTPGIHTDSGGAPGDPGPGASSVVQNETGGAVPNAEPLPEGEPPRDAIRGDATGVVPTSNLEVRRGIAFQCDRPEATVYVNDLMIGEVGQYSSKDEPYEFPQEGSFSIRVVAKDGTEARITVVASAGAQTDVELIRVRLAKP